MVGKISPSPKVRKTDTAILVCNTELRVVWCNEAAEELWGLLAKDIVRKSILEILKIDPTTSKEIFEQLVRKGHWQGETQFTRQGQIATHLYVSFDTLKDETGDPTTVAAIVRQSPESRRPEPDLDKMHTVGGMLDTLTEGACIIDDQYNIAYMNPALEKISGYPRNKCYQHFFRRADICPWCECFGNLPEKKAGWKSFYTSQGRTYEYEDSPMVDSLGRPRVLRIFHDVTEDVRTAEEFTDYKVRVEDAINQHSLQLEQSSKALRENVRQTKKQDTLDAE